MRNSQQLIDETEDRVREGARSAERVVRKAADVAQQEAGRWRDLFAPKLERFSRRAGDAAREGVSQLRRDSERYQPTSTWVETATRRLRERPEQAMLVAAAAGAVLFAVGALLSGRRPR